jgi:hypothetical protein
MPLRRKAIYKKDWSVFISSFRFTTQLKPLYEN